MFSGDILSDEASAIAGSIGLLPSASLCGIPSSPVPGIYEPIHGETPILFEPSCRHQSLTQMTGSAPDISGKGIVVRQDPVLGDSYPFAASTELT